MQPSETIKTKTKKKIQNCTTSHCILTGHFSRWTWFSRYQNVSILNFIGAKDDGGGGGQLEL